MSEPILVTRALTKKYGGAAAVEGVDLYIEKGQIYGLVGRNGAGKTTIIRMLTAQTVPTSGEIELFGETDEKGISAARARVGAMVEIPSFYPYLTARENLEYYRRQRGIPGEACVDRALEQVGLHDAGKKKFKQFSLGMKQRLGLALALMNHPDLLLLDEHTAALDPKTAAKVLSMTDELIEEHGLTAIMITHNMKDAIKYGNRLIMMMDGKIIYDVSGEEKEKLKVADLLEKFETSTGEEFANDRMLLI